MKKFQSEELEVFFRFKTYLYSCDIGLSTMMLKKNLFSKNIRFPNIKTKEDFILMA